MTFEMSPCWNCGYPVDVRVKVCPYCHSRLKRSWLTLFLMIFGILAVMGLMALVLSWFLMAM
jgi:hypothetical protein